MTDDQLFLANAYLDDELDAQQRQLAESDPEVVQEIAALRSLRADLRDVAPASSATREAAIAAALSAWSPAAAVPEGSVASVAPADPPPSVSTSRAPSRAISSGNASSGRMSSMWWLGAAAAVVGITLGGVIVTRGRSVSDDAGSVKMEAATAPVAAAPDANPSDRAAAMDTSASAMAESEMMASASADFEMSPAEPMDRAMSESDWPGITVVPLPTLDFSADDLRSTADRLDSGRLGPDDTTADDTSRQRACAASIPDSSAILGETTAANNDTERPSVVLIVILDLLSGEYYAIDADTCLAVQSAA